MVYCRKENSKKLLRYNPRPELEVVPKDMIAFAEIMRGITYRWQANDGCSCVICKER